MIHGSVNLRLDATVSLVTVDTYGGRHTIQAVIDTGFNGFLTLPPALVVSFGLPMLLYGRARLADGTEQLLSTYRGKVVWDRRMRNRGYPKESQPLIGMGLMEGFQLPVDVVPRGKLTIQRLSPARPRKKTKRR